VANWTVATMFERLSEVLEEEKVIPAPLLAMDGAGLAEINMEDVVEVLKDRIVADQFSPKAKATARKAKTEATPKADA
jgi:hypothetical protein